jgi:ATP-binding cassette subfamily B protein
MQMTYLLKTGGLMLGLAALGMVIAIVVGFVASRTGAAIGAELRSKLFTRVVSFSEAEIGRFSAASLITRGTNDIQLVQNVSIMMMRMVLYAPILAIGGIIMVMQTNPRMGWIIVVAIVAVFVVIAVLFKLAMPKFKIMQKLIDRVNLVAREILTGMPVIRAFGRTQSEEARFDVASTELMRTQLFTNRVMTFMMPTMTLIMNATSVAIVWVGGHYIDEGLIQTGDMIAFITYSMVIIMGFLMLGMISIMLPRADVAASRVDEVIATEPSIHDAEGAVALAAVGSDSAALAEPACASGIEPAPSPSAKNASEAGAKVEFCDVSFKYDDSSECVLEHVSFVVEPGQTLGIIGATGCGKSTIMKLIERFYDASAGEVKVDGIDVRKVSQASLRRTIAYVPQKAFLFSGTIESNVAYSEGQMDPARVARALKLAQASEFVYALPEGVDSPISEGGTNVSGGQRQRLAIARALAADARVLLFDDSFSALDYKTDLALRTALDAELAGTTRIIAAQRIATIRNADSILVLDDGQVVGLGTHDELIRGCEQYKEIALSQLSEEELGLEGGDL